MQITLSFSAEEYSAVREKTLVEILTATAAKSAAQVLGTVSDQDGLGPEYSGVDMEDVYDLTLHQVQKWMAGASDKTKIGMRIVAEHGPIIRAKQLTDAGIDNLAHFQSRTTIRTRTITGERSAFLLGWDDWSEVVDGEGRYAVTPLTHRSLRQYFKLS